MTPPYQTTLCFFKSPYQATLSTLSIKGVLRGRIPLGAPGNRLGSPSFSLPVTFGFPLYSRDIIFIFATSSFTRSSHHFMLSSMMTLSVVIALTCFMCSIISSSTPYNGNTSQHHKVRGFPRGMAESVGVGPPADASVHLVHVLPS